MVKMIEGIKVGFDETKTNGDICIALPIFLYFIEGRMS